MSFREKWEALEYEFQQRVEADNKKLSIESSYVHNFVPNGPVDYILIAMEPSTGVPAAGAQVPSSTSEIDRNFTWSVEDFIFHYCIRNYLCSDGQTYHLTDLAKGAMTTDKAKETQQWRYKKWYPLLEEELSLLNKKEGTRIVAVGKTVFNFLRPKGLCENLEQVLHYSPNFLQINLPKVVHPWIADFPEFSHSVNQDAFKESIDQVLRCANMESYIGKRPVKEPTLTEISQEVDVLLQD